MPDLQAQATALRADGHKLRAFVSFFVGQEVAEFEPDENYTDSEYPLTAISGAYASGSEPDVGEGFLVEIRRSTGELREVTRTRYGATQAADTLHIRELSRATSVTGSPDVLVIRREVRLSDKLVEATEDFDPDGIPVGTFNLNPPPIANSGGLDVGFVDSGQTYRTVQFFGDLSFAVDPASGGTLTHTWTIPTGGGAFQSGSTSAAENPIMEINVGHWLIQHDVEDDDNGQITTQYIMVVVHDHSSAAPYECLIEPIEGGKEDGWGYRVQVFEDATETDIPYGSYAIVWVDETINGTTQSFGSPVTGRSHIKAVGIIRREETREDGTTDSLTFEIISPLARLGELAGFSKVMIREASPDAWSEINTLKTQRAILQLVMFYCNFNNAGFDIIIDADVPDYDYPLLFLQKDSPLGQIRELAAATQSRFICDRRGRFELQPILNLLTRTARDNRTTSYVFSRDDIIDIQVSQEHWRPVETFRLKGFSAHATTPNPVFAKYPGDAPGVGNLSGSMERIICQNVVQAYFFCGLYGAMEDGWFVNSQGIGRFAPRVTLTVPGSYDVLDFYGEWIEFDFALRLRGLDLSAYRYELVRASVTYDSGTAQCVFELQAETFGEPGVDDEPQSNDGSDLTDWEIIWQPIEIPPEYLTLLLADTARLWHIQYRDFSADESSLITTTDSYQTETETTYASLGINGRHCAAQQDPFEPSRIWVATTEEVGYIADIAGTSTWVPGSGDSDLGLISGDVVQSIWMHTNIAAQNWVVIGVYVTNTGADKYYLVTTRDGQTWTSTAVASNRSPFVWVSAHRAGRMFLFDYPSSTLRVRRSDDYGATFPVTLTIPNVPTNAFIFGWHFPYKNNADDGIFYFSTRAPFGALQFWVYDHGTVTSLDSVVPNTTTGNVDIGGIGLRGIDTYSSDRNIVAMMGHRFEYSLPVGWALDVSAGGYTYSDDGAASWLPASVGNTRTRGIAISGNDPLVRWRWGAGGLIEKTIDGVNFSTLRDDTVTTLMDDAVVEFGGLP